MQIGVSRTWRPDFASTIAACKTPGIARALHRPSLWSSILPTSLRPQRGICKVAKEGGKSMVGIGAVQRRGWGTADPAPGGRIIAFGEPDTRDCR